MTGLQYEVIDTTVRVLVLLVCSQKCCQISCIACLASFVPTLGRICLEQVPRVGLAISIVRRFEQAAQLYNPMKDCLAECSTLL